MICADFEVSSVGKMYIVHIRERPVSFVFLAVLGLETESCWLTTPMRIGGRWVPSGNPKVAKIPSNS